MNVRGGYFKSDASSPIFQTPTPCCGKAVMISVYLGMTKKKEHTDHDPKTGTFVEGNQAHTLRENPGRKSKASRFVEAFACVVDDAHPVGKAIIHTDKDLLRLTNMKLKEQGHEDYQISMSTFERYKRGENGEASERVLEDLGNFESLYMRALLRQRENLFNRMTEKGEARSWGRWSWIIERKFDEWNLRSKQVDETPDRKQLVFRVHPGDDDDGKK